MKRFSTQCMDELKDKTKKNRNEKKSTPSRQTLDSCLSLHGVTMWNLRCNRNSVVM